MNYHLAVITHVMLVFLGAVLAVPLDLRDVFVPPVLYPATGTVWKIGSRHNVTWDISTPPSQITNKLGRILLAKNGTLDIEHPLAVGFDIMNGRQVVAVPPHVKPDADYQVVVFGDSGNMSKKFTITE
ncbi:hypothetical protein BDN72DRAFT_959501 [Pluteus cervinus]|uniref:Uncharacterized protein n=1 Tax=Pluteus cervinus TaxID=181527 RepID=A0ACD3AUL4_9AGAR|nr:hypothetical protein BDN72DRAFT_959501 [Pluteus cervinus]